MSIQAVLLPLFVQVMLTFVLLVWMASLNRSAVLRREVRLEEVALREPSWPGRNLQFRNAFHNQLETPVLFYVLTILAWITRHADLLFVVLAWIFVVSRLVHAYIHISSNHVPTRFNAFAVGAIVLLLMWIMFAVRILII